jgi:hypothetical protein
MLSPGVKESVRQSRDPAVSPPVDIKRELSTLAEAVLGWAA